jgi:hypothetical protein
LTKAFIPLPTKVAFGKLLKRLFLSMVIEISPTVVIENAPTRVKKIT